jgi:hypothetical protein
MDVTPVPSDAAVPAVTEPARFPLVFGLDTFGDVTHDQDDRPLSHAQTIRNVVEQGIFADHVGADYFGIGEHHTNDFPMPAADVVLGANRFDLKYGMGGLSHEALMTNIELYGVKVIPLVRELLA